MELIGKMIILTLGMDYLPDRNYVLMVQRAQILYLAEGRQREPLVLHLVHDHV